MHKIKVFFDREQNLLIHIIASFFVILFGVIFKLNITDWVLIFSMIGFVIVSELINSAIELVVDLYTNKFNSLAMIAKDTAAAAVVTAAFTSILVGIYVFLPKLIAIIK